MKVLVACEESQEVCKAFRARGHEAYSCDIQEPSGGHPEWGILGDALEAITGGKVTTMDGQTHDIGKWDLLIAHPPCTYLSNAGARHLWKDHQLQADRVMLGIQARDFFMRFWLADVPRIAVENPVPSRVFAMPEYTQAIQPYQFGHPFTKKPVYGLKIYHHLCRRTLSSRLLHGARPVLTAISTENSIEACLLQIGRGTGRKHSLVSPVLWRSNGEEWRTRYDRQ